MLLKFGTPCRTKGDHLGTLWGLCIEPREKLLLRAVVEEPQAEPLVRIYVPFGRLDFADAEQVSVGMSADEFRRMPRYEPSSNDGGSKRSRRRRRGDEVIERVLTAKTPVFCRDGEAGKLVAITVDQRSGDFEDLSLLTGADIPREVVVEGRRIEEITEERISLEFERDQLGELPSRRV